MNYASVTGLRWADADQTRIDCTVDFEGIGPVPFTATAADGTLHGLEIFTRAVAGDFGEIASRPVPTLEDRRGMLLAAVNIRLDAALAAGAPVTVGEDTLHVALDDGSRADMTGMAATALAAAGGAVPWPDSYALGWITIENVRIPLTMPGEGLVLAASVGNHYATIRQNARTLKDAVLAAADEVALDAIDIDAGW